MFAAALLVAAFAAQSPDSELTATFNVLRGAATGFRQDLAQASPQLVLGRAARVRAACDTSRAAADSLAPRLPPDAPARTVLAALQRALSTCQREWNTSGSRVNVDSLRAWGPHRLSELDRALLRYQRARLVRGLSRSQ